jgi:hypothetical protein
MIRFLIFLALGFLVYQFVRYFLRFYLFRDEPPPKNTATGVRKIDRAAEVDYIEVKPPTDKAEN